eukprot:scaffold74058_cov60-Attheya_sp.AAC.2
MMWKTRLKRGFGLPILRRPLTEPPPGWPVMDWTTPVRSSLSRLYYDVAYVADMDCVTMMMMISLSLEGLGVRVGYEGWSRRRCKDNKKIRGARPTSTINYHSLEVLVVICLTLFCFKSDLTHHPPHRKRTPTMHRRPAQTGLGSCSKLRAKRRACYVPFF